MVSKSWKLLDATQRVKWEEKARVDKERYEKEKAAYKGPWKVPDIKYPDAPKKPMSAFLSFGNARRKAIAEANPFMSNAEISSLLSKLWKECPPDVKQAYRDREVRQRETFKKYRAEWELMKQQEAGVETPMEKITRPKVGRRLSMDDELLHLATKSLTSSCESPQGGSIDDWDNWTSSSDFDANTADEAQLTMASSPSVYATSSLPTQSPRLSSDGPCVAFLPQTQQSASYRYQCFSNFNLQHHQGPETALCQPKTIRDYTLEELLEDEELFEDFSPLDSPMTAPFVNNALIPPDQG